MPLYDTARFSWPFPDRFLCFLRCRVCRRLKRGVQRYDVVRLRRVFEVGGSGREKAVRTLLLIGLFVVCGFAFQAHFARRFADIEARHAFLDETGSVRPEERAVLDAAAAGLREGWGLRVLVHVRSGAVLAPKIGPDRLFVGVAPGRRQALVLLPPLVKRAVPAGLEHELEMRLDECALSRPAALCAAETLRALERVLAGSD